MLRVRGSDADMNIVRGIEKHKVNIADVTKGLTILVKLRGVKRFRVRMFFVTLLIRLASIISPVRIDVTQDE